MFGKRLEDISFEDVQEFCAEGNPEGQYLDYKRGLSDKDPSDQVAKLVSGMANAQGGWILFGVEEDGQDQEGRGLPGKITGIPADKQPASRIRKICLSNIFPPAVPDMKTIELPTDSGRVVIIAQVQPSDSAPHELKDGTVHIRVADISYLPKDGRQAYVREVESLLNRRAAQTQTRETLIYNAVNRVAALKLNPTFTISVVPTYPTSNITDYLTLNRLAKASKDFPAFGSINRFQSVHHGLFSQFNIQYPNGGGGASLELNVFGLINLLGVIPTPDNGHTRSVEAIIRRLFDFAEFATYVYKELSLETPCDFRLGMECRRGERLMISSLHPIATCLENSFTIHRATRPDELLDKDFLWGMFAEFLWSSGFGEIGITDENYRAIFNQFFERRQRRDAHSST